MQQIGTVNEVWNHPANHFVAQFIGEPGMNFIPGKLKAPGEVSISSHGGERTLAFTGEADAECIGSEITVGARPQQIKMVPAGGTATVPSEVKVVEFRGERTILTLELSDTHKTRVKVDISASVKKQRGETCWREFAPEIIHLFNDQGKAIITRGVDHRAAVAHSGGVERRRVPDVRDGG